MTEPYSARILTVDLDREQTGVVEVDGSVLRCYIGGVGLAAKILAEETSAAVTPFSPANRLMFMTGPVTGLVPMSSRAVVCGLSPANDAWGEATIGGTWGAEFSKTGFSGIVVSGRARRPVYLYIRDDKVRIADATHLWGQDAVAAHDRLRQETDPKASIAVIGQAGERLVRIASIMGDGRLGRAAARCGMGAVMGSKNLKAVVVRGTRKPPAADAARLRAINREVTQLLTRVRSGALGRQPEPRDAIARNNDIGNLGIKNHTLARWDAFNKKFQDEFKVGKSWFCPLCAVGCLESHVIERDGQPVRQAVLEMWMPVAANCMIDNLDAVQECYELCNRYGIDTISFGYTLAFAMEAFERGLITRQDTGGIDLTWGNHEAMLQMVRLIGENEGFGQVLAQGSKRAAEHIGGDAPRYALHVKGLETTHWDPRIYNSLAIAYATGNKGGSHFESPAHIVERGLGTGADKEGKIHGYGMDLAELGYPQGMSRLGFEGKSAVAKKVQDLVCMINSLVICQFSHAKGVRIAEYTGWLNAITGWEMTAAEFLQTGERIFNLKRLINLGRGLSASDDRLPERLLTKLPGLSDEEQGVPDSFRQLLQEYYSLRGWTAAGVPTPEKLAELGLGPGTR